MSGSFWEIAEEATRASGLAGEKPRPPMRDVLVSAIYHDRLGELMNAYQSDPPEDLSESDHTELTEALAAITQINEEIDAHSARLEQLLADAGVGCARTDQEKGVQQFHAFKLRIDRSGLSRALRVLANEKYPLASALCDGAIAALAATKNKLELMQDSQQDMRVTLSWKSDGLARRLPRRLTPTFADFRAMRLPSSLWPIYVVIRPFRVVIERWIGPDYRADSDFVFSSVNLGTPHSLISPLLRVASLTSEDKLVDLGCGDGRVIAAAIDEYGCEVLGIESNSTLAGLARKKTSSAPVGRSRVENRIGTPEDVVGATVVFLFQPMALAVTLIPDLLAVMSPGGRVVLHEQTALHPELKPGVSLPVFSENAMSIAHIWRT